MPAWLMMALPYIARAPSLAVGLLHLGQAIASEIASKDDTVDKAAKVAQEFADHVPAIEAALIANTPRA